MRDWISRTWRALQPADDTRKGAAWGAVALLGVVTAVATASYFGPGLGPLRLLKSVNVWTGQISLAASHEIPCRIEIASAIAEIRLPRPTG